MSIDEDSGLVLVPTGSASPDFFGGTRLGSNRFADSLLALDAKSGKLVWHQQLVHHDLWDYDLAAQPVLGDIEVQGVPVPAVIQATKTGMLYVFDRTKGQPLFPITEKPVPPSFVAGEQAAPTQPFSSIASLVSQKPVDPADAWGITFWDRASAATCSPNIAMKGSSRLRILTAPSFRQAISAASIGAAWYSTSHGNA